MPHISIRDVAHYYEQAGEGHPLVLIHGAFADARVWEAQWGYFSARRRVLRYDLRGHGRTGPSSLAHYTMATFADDLAALLEALGIESPIICGLSMGGVVAQAFAARYPTRPKALILASTQVSASLTLSEKLLRYVLMPRWLVLPAIRKVGVQRFTRFSLWLARRLWGQQWLGGHQDIQQYIEQCMLQMESREFLKLWEVIYSFDLLPLEQITCPTLVLNGEHESKGALRHTAEILHRIPHANAEVVPGGSHAMNLENPVEFNRLIEAYLRTLTS
ncbi:MAG: alpha/beta hydrolase [Anaerolineales bacterium]|nr:alpha/beta hydrolase [Anaerolineales bacterium]